VITNILDTEVVMKNNKPHLSKKDSKHGYVSDADVSNFGRKDFFVLRNLVVKELGLDLSNPEIKKKFLNFAYELLKNQEWKTNSARHLRQKQKEINLREVEKQLRKL